MSIFSTHIGVHLQDDTSIEADTLKGHDTVTLDIGNPAFDRTSITLYLNSADQARALRDAATKALDLMREVEDERPATILTEV
jgi:hypothetical protein